MILYKNLIRVTENFSLGESGSTRTNAGRIAGGGRHVNIPP